MTAVRAAFGIAPELYTDFAQLRRKVLDKAKAHGCVVEVIMKDISTVRYEPQRLWEWSQMATELTAQYGD